MILIGSALIAAFTAYILIPGLGGLRARSRWRDFRERMVKSALLPEASFDPGGPDEVLGSHRFTGRIEALQREDSLWVRGSTVSVQALMAGSEIYILSTDESGTPDARTLLEERLPEDQPGSMSWKQITSLQEGSRIYLVGFLERRDGVLRMYGSRDVPLLAILHEGDDVVPRAVWSGRQKNEYWNPLTPWALLAGSLGLFILATTAFRFNQVTWTARLVLLAALFPVVPFLPPGLALFFLYLSNWRRARFLRAERDLLGLNAYLRAGDATSEMAGWGEDLPRDTIPLIRSCRRRALVAELVAGLAFSAGFLMNAILALLILNYVT